jgi:hypothetical protein
MPEIMQKMSVVSLNYWAIQGFFDVLGRDAAIGPVMTKVGILFLIGIIMSIISAIIFRRNMLKMV